MKASEMRAVKQHHATADAAWRAEMRKRETVTVRCAWCKWKRTGTADVVLEEQRAHVRTHPQYVAFKRARKAPAKTLNPEQDRAARLARPRRSQEEKRQARREYFRERRGSRFAATHCQWENCGKELPADRHQRTMYCGKTHLKLAYLKRKRDREAAEAA